MKNCFNICLSIAEKKRGNSNGGKKLKQQRRDQNSQEKKEANKNILRVGKKFSEFKSFAIKGVGRKKQMGRGEEKLRRGEEKNIRVEFLEGA